MPPTRTHESGWNLPTLKKLNDFICSIAEDIPQGQLPLIKILFVLGFIVFAYQGCAGDFKLTLGNLVKDAVPRVLLAWGAGLLLAAGKVDVSSAGNATLAGVIFALVYNLYPTTFGVLFGVLAACATGLVIGFINGYLVAKRSAPSLLVTWGMGTLTYIIAAKCVYQVGLGKGRSSGSISLHGSVPESMFKLVWNDWFGVFLYVLVAVGLLLYALRLSFLARAIGANSLGMTYSGFRVKRVIIVLFSLGGLFSSVTGCLWAVAGWNASITDHLGKEMVMIAIAVLGGTAMNGGYFSLWGILVAAIFWTTVSSCLQGLNFNFGLEDSRLVQALFSTLIIGVSYFLGQQMSGEMKTVLTDDQSHQETTP